MRFAILLMVWGAVANAEEVDSRVVQDVFDALPNRPEGYVPPSDAVSPEAYVPPDLTGEQMMTAVEGAAPVDVGAPIRAVLQCWLAQPDAVPVTVLFNLGRDGRVVNNVIALISSGEGTADQVDRSYVAARRAILRCQGDGFDLPADQYDRWSTIELSFAGGARGSE